MNDILAAIASAAGYCGFFPPFAIICVFGSDRIDNGPVTAAVRP